MTKRSRILVTVAASLGVFVIAILIAALIIVQTAWFQNFVREKIVSSTEEATGGKVDIGSFSLSLSHLRVRITNFVLHGTEPAGSAPLLRVESLDLELKLLSSLKDIIDLQYLGITRPEANVLVFADGNTNIPKPKPTTKPSRKSGLQTIVELAVKRFELTNGTLHYLSQSIPLDVRGENLRVGLQYDTRSPAYEGSLQLDPIIAKSGNRAPLIAHLDVPVRMEEDAVRIQNARLSTANSSIELSADVAHMAAPVVNAKAAVHVSIDEIWSIAGAAGQAPGKGAPRAADADIALSMDEQRIDVQTLRLSLGRSNFEASGALKDPSGRGSLAFKGSLLLDELSKLANVSAEPRGTVLLNGSARLSGNSQYLVTGNIQGRNITARNGARELGPVSLETPFRIDPELIELAGLKLNAFGGELRAKADLKQMRQLALNGQLSGFDIQRLAHDLGAKPIGYDAVISGTIAAAGDLKATGTTGYTADLQLNIAGGNRGVPVNGWITASYSGKTDAISLGNSYAALPHTRLDLMGVLGDHLSVKLVSRNLNDFLPALNAASSQTSQAMPVALEGGTAQVNANIDGPLRSPTINGNLQVTKFAAEQRKFDRLYADLHASDSGANIANGVLQSQKLQAHFDGGIGLHQWSTTPQSPVTANASIRNAGLEDLMALAGEAPGQFTGTLNASAKIGGTMGSPSGGANVDLANGSAYGEPFQHALAQLTFSDQLAKLQPVEIAAGTARLTASATYVHSRDSMATGHIQLNVGTNTISLSQFKTLEARRPGFSGDAQVNADLTADVVKEGQSSTIDVRAVTANLSATHLKDKGGSYGDVTASAHTANNSVIFELNSNVSGGSTSLNGTTQLAAGYPTKLDVSIDSLQVEKALLLAGQNSVPAEGVLTAQAHLEGPVKNPTGNLSLDLTKAMAYGEPITELKGQMSYAADSVQIPQFRLATPAGSIQVNGKLNHPANNFNQGTLLLHVDSSPIDLAQIHNLQNARPGLKGTLRILTDLNAGLNLEDKRNPVLISQLNSNVRAEGIVYNAQDFGSLDLEARTQGKQIALSLDSDLAKSSVKARANIQIAPGYPVNGKLYFSNVRYANFAPLLAAAGSTSESSSMDVLAAGMVSMQGPLADTKNFQATLSVNQLELSSTSTRDSLASGNPVVLIKNNGPIVIALDRSRVDIRSARLEGRSTNISASGDINFVSTQPLNVKLNAATDLSVLQDFSRDVYSGGSITANVVVLGTLAQPVANGRVELKNASVNLADSPNGISNANGVILLNGTTASIRNLTAESGGGKITVNGYAGLTGTTVRYGLRLTGTKVRTRYSGVSILSDAALALNGTLDRSLLSGTITIDRIAMAQQSDTGSLLSMTAAPPETPAAPSGPLQGMRLDIHVVTSSALSVQTSVSQNLSGNADLTVRGTLLDPGVLGQVRITEGNLVFFGNEYSVNRGVINFYNPVKIDPILDIALETSVQGVDVTLGVTGPIDNMKLNYRSDPPLRFDEIVSLLAAGKTPTTDPTIAAQQPPPPDQSFTQMGESAIVSQAVAAPIASRLQRVFGINQIKIDPTFTSGSDVPQAMVTLQQQISPTILMTYTTDLTDTTAQIIKVEWAFTPKFSAVVSRNEWGILSLNFYWKKQLK
ncbi:MAG: translocation/assembly module TamB domain-containing protein [Bryobacteraceae bacterium]